MCGVAGFMAFGEAPSQEERIQALCAMLTHLVHRGPDEAGYMVDERIALGAVRLQINDLRLGQQPLTDPGNRYWLAYNGEIYNFIELRRELVGRGWRFQTQSDTEVALAAWIVWGTTAPERFDGGFAFALYDRVQRELYLVRDRYGKRPLFIRSLADGGIAFASEVKAFLGGVGCGALGQPLRWDLAGLAAIFAKWAPTGAESPYAGVSQLEPGTIAHFGPTGRRRDQRYGGWPVARRPAAGEGAAAPTAADQRATVERLQAAVARRLRGDVEVGVLLSGGLDSAIVAALARDAQPGKLRSFSVAFSRAEYDESADQQLVAAALGCEHHTLEVDDGAIAEGFAAALWHAEIPQFRTAPVPLYLLAQQIRRQGIKVVLSGEGADEVFLGYDLFRETRLRAHWSVLDPTERRAQLGRLYPYLPLFAEAHLKALEAQFARLTTRPDDLFFSHALRFENGRFALRLLSAGASTGLEVLERAMEEADLAKADPLTRAQWLEGRTLLEGYLLSSQGDRMLFAHGVEPRNPFLSRSVVEFAMAKPAEWLLTPAGREKHLLKEAFAQRLPGRITAKPKQPYRAPDTRAFMRPEGGFRDWVEEALTATALRAVEPLDGQYAQRLVAKLRKTPPERVSPREDQAFLLLLSLVLLQGQLITQGRRPTLPPLSPLRRTVRLTPELTPSSPLIHGRGGDHGG
ncbi:MAG: asparagine synthase (glutamine-hydrolyzing) [Candidatus Competibacterales bacterium]